MTKRITLFLSLILVIVIPGCIRETYDLNLLSKNAHLTPTIVLSANGDVSLKDMVKTNDTITFDPNKLMTLVFRKNSVIDLKLNDFSKGTLRSAVIHPGSIDLNIDEILNRITGTIQILNPSVKFIYTNSFSDPVTMDLIVTGVGKTADLNLNQAPFTLASPNIPSQQVVNATYLIDKTNSNLPQLLSIPPRMINYSGSAILDISGNYNLISSRLTGALEVSVPMELRMNNLQYSDTIDNFLKDENDSPVDPANFHFLSMKISAQNGFPFSFSLKMSTYNSVTKKVLSTVDAGKVIEPAPVDASGKANGFTSSTPDIEVTKDFFTSSGKSDKLIFTFTLNTTGNGSTDVKIYSDYRINFKAALVVKPDIDLSKVEIFKIGL